MKVYAYRNLPIHIILLAPKELSDKHIINCYKENLLYTSCEEDENYFGVTITGIGEEIQCIAPGKLHFIIVISNIVFIFCL